MRRVWVCWKHSKYSLSSNYIVDSRVVVLMSYVRAEVLPELFSVCVCVNQA